MQRGSGATFQWPDVSVRGGGEIHLPIQEVPGLFKHLGAVVGKHSIIVRPPEDEGSMAGATPPVPIHADMLSYEKSGLNFEVKPGPNTCPLTVRKP